MQDLDEHTDGEEPIQNNERRLAVTLHIRPASPDGSAVAYAKRCGAL